MLPRVSSMVRDGPMRVSTVCVDDQSWFPLCTYWDTREIARTLDTNQPSWLEIHPDAPDNLEVLNSIVTPFADATWAEMQVLVKAKSCQAYVRPYDSICRLRPLDADCIRAIEDFRIAYVTREQEAAFEPTQLSNFCDC